MESITYNVPSSILKDYGDENLIVRVRDLSEIPEIFAKEPPANVLYVQFDVQDVDTTPLMRLNSPVPLDLVVTDPEKDPPLLYRFAPLTARRPVRVSVPVVPGFGRAAKLALSLSFSVKLVVSQPGRDLVSEMARVLDEYLHLATVDRPVEFFHGLLLVFYHGDPATLWDIQEENPANFRFVTDEGEETPPPRLSGLDHGRDVPSFLADFGKELAAEKGECRDCEFAEVCGGYFKWPRREYSCEAIKELLLAVKQAAGELKNDMDSCGR